MKKGILTKKIAQEVVLNLFVINFMKIFLSEFFWILRKIVELSGRKSEEKIWRKSK